MTSNRPNRPRLNVNAVRGQEVPEYLAYCRVTDRDKRALNARIMRRIGGAS